MSLELRGILPPLSTCNLPGYESDSKACCSIADPKSPLDALERGYLKVGHSLCLALLCCHLQPVTTLCCLYVSCCPTEYRIY